VGYGGRGYQTGWMMGTDGDLSCIPRVALDTVAGDGRTVVVCQDPLFANNPGMEF